MEIRVVGKGSWKNEKLESLKFWNVLTEVGQFPYSWKV